MGAPVVMLSSMIRRAVWGAPVLSLLGCASAAPVAAPRTAADVTAPASFVDAQPVVVQARPARAADAPGTRRVGVDEWSFAVGEDWQQRDQNGSRQYVLSLGEAGTVIASVGHDPRPRGPAEEAYRDVLADLLEQYGEAGVRVVSTHAAAVDGEPAMEVSLVSQYAGRRVASLIRAQVEGSVTSQVWCTAPIEQLTTARAECPRIRLSLRATDPVTAAPGTRVIRRGAVSVTVPEGWIDALHRDDNTMVARSETGPDSITVEIETAPLEGTAAHYLTDVLQGHRDAGATVVSHQQGTTAGRRWIDTEISMMFPESSVMVQRMVLHGDQLFSVTCAEPSTELAAGRSRCRAVVESFRFGSQ